MDLPDKSGGQPAPNPQKKVEQVVEGGSLVKRPASRRFKDFIMAESPKVLAVRIGQDVFWPRIKAGLEESFNSFIHGMFWGGGQAPPSNLLKSPMLRGGVSSYSAISAGMMSPQAMAMQANMARPTGEYQDIAFPSQQQAEHLLANMYDLLNRYRVVSVGDLYEMAGIPTLTSHSNYGWSDLSGARISKTREGFLLELPRPSIIS